MENRCDLYGGNEYFSVHIQSKFMRNFRKFPHRNIECCRAGVPVQEREDYELCSRRCTPLKKWPQGKLCFSCSIILFFSSFYNAEQPAFFVDFVLHRFFSHAAKYGATSAVKSKTARSQRPKRAELYNLWSNSHRTRKSRITYEQDNKKKYKNRHSNIDTLARISKPLNRIWGASDEK